MNRVVVTGVGAITAYGRGAAPLFEGMMAGRSSIRPLDEPLRSRLPWAVASIVDDGIVRRATAEKKLIGLDRATELALIAVQDAIADAHIEFDEELAAETGIYVGTGMGGAASTEESYHRLYERKTALVRPTTVISSMANAPAAWISIQTRLRGPTITYCVACASSSIAIGEAFRAVQRGDAQVMIAVGTEALLVNGVFLAWRALGALAATDENDPSRSCRPFSADRTGLALSEGACAFVLENLEFAHRRGRKPLAEISGFGLSSDAGHITKPSPEGQSLAMQRALRSAHLSPDDIDYINAHGTATDVGDISETEAIKKVFGERAYSLPISSTKSMHGHMLGAAGAIELLISIMAVKEGAVPPTAHLDVRDPLCDLDYVPNTGRSGVKLRAAMSNSFAFGGCNASLIVQEAC